MSPREPLKKCSRIVIKVGSSSLTYDNGNINLNSLDILSRQIADLMNQGKQVILVSSGAIAAGRSYLEVERPEKLADKQAIASVGQAVLMQLYRRCFSDYHKNIGQVLLTKDIMLNKQRCENAKNTLEALLSMGVIPIVNENDTVATDEIEFGDNDTLSATVACLVEADLLILLSDIDGLYDSNPNENPNANLIEEVNEITEDIMGMGTGSSSQFGTGGMATKLKAGLMAGEKGIPMVIANASNMRNIGKIMDGRKVGTLFTSK